LIWNKAPTPPPPSPTSYTIYNQGLRTEEGQREGKKTYRRLVFRSSGISDIGRQSCRQQTFCKIYNIKRKLDGLKVVTAYGHFSFPEEYIVVHHCARSSFGIQGDKRSSFPGRIKAVSQCESDI
jgi:hypothetical protein